jgi:hypothetical protein
MSKEEYTSEHGKSSRARLKLTHLPVKPVVRIRLGGTEPSENMQPSEYKVSCEAAAIRQFQHGGFRVDLYYRVIDGEHTGTALRQWFTISASGVVSPQSRYAQQCAVALGRPVDTSDDLHNPDSIFRGRILKPSSDSESRTNPRAGSTARRTPTVARARKTACGSTSCWRGRSCSGGDVHMYMSMYTCRWG